MKIRAHYPIVDRLKLMAVLFVLLLLLESLVQFIEQKNADRKDATIEKLLQAAIQPVGTTMYIWGGGWNDEDNAAGGTATRMGLYPQWERFAQSQDEDYDFTEHRLERENGLDCSGYVGWVIYNTFEEVSGKDGYVTTSTDMAKYFAEKGWGEYIENPTDFLAGDIVSMEGHVWISLGTCEDGSVLLAHSSPPGVSICGTQIEEGKNSIAIELATNYMETYYPKWQKKYPNRAVSHAYLEDVTLMRWSPETMLDAAKMQRFGGEEIMELICLTTTHR